MLRFLLAFFAFALLPPVHADEDAETTPPPSCSTLPQGELAHNLENRLVATVDAELVHSTLDDISVSVSLEHVLNEGWNCAEWEVEILLMPGKVVVKDNGATKLENLTRTSVAEFDLELEYVTDDKAGELASDLPHAAESFQYNGAFAIKVFNRTGVNDEIPIQESDSVWDGHGRYHRGFTVGNRER